MKNAFFGDREEEEEEGEERGKNGKGKERRISIKEREKGEE